MLLALIHGRLISLSKKRKWSLDAFRRAHAEILRRKFTFREYWKKPARSPDRKRSAQILIDMDTTAARVFLEVTDGDRISRVQYGTPTSYDEMWMYYLGDLKWTSNKTLRQRTHYKMRSVQMSTHHFVLTTEGVQFKSDESN
jgi:hypothetical protein